MLQSCVNPFPILKVTLRDKTAGLNFITNWTVPLLSDRANEAPGALQDEPECREKMGKMGKMVSRDHLVLLDHKCVLKF